MMKLVIFSFTAMTFVFAAQVQDTYDGYRMPLESRIGLSVGIGSVTYLDTNSSPLVYRSRPKNE